MQNRYGIIQSPLSILCQEREAWKVVERISRVSKDRSVHAFSKHRIEEISEQIMSIARDEMSSDDKEENLDDIDFTE